MSGAEPRTESIALDHTTLAVHHWGGEATPVLLAHPTGFHGRIWAPVAQRLVAAGHRVVSFDFRGHGNSDAPPLTDHDYSWHGFADDVLALNRHLGLAGDPTLIAAGHSKGAAALLLAEARAPGTFARLWCYEPIVFPTDAPLPPDPDFVLAVGARRRRDTWASPQEALAAYASKPPLDVMSPASLRAYVEYALRDRGDGTFVLKCRPEIEAQVYAMGPAHGAYSQLADVRCPTRVVVGARTDAIPPKLAERVVARLTYGTLEVWDEAGHFGPQASPDRAAQSIRGAIADPPTGSTG